MNFAMKGDDEVGPIAEKMFGNAMSSGREAARLIQTASGNGKTPISRLMAAGHGGSGKKYIFGKHANGTTAGTFSVNDLFKLYTASSGHASTSNTYKEAVDRKGPPLCWFTKNAKVYLVGCKTGYAARYDWADRLLRDNMIVYGTQHVIYAGLAGARPYYQYNSKLSHFFWVIFDENCS